MTATPAEVPDLGDGARDFLKALASETRQQVMMLFAGGAELSVGEVAERAGLGQSTASEHLALLRRGGLVTSTRHGKVVRYRTDSAAVIARMEELKAYLLACCPPVECVGNGEC